MSNFCYATRPYFPHKDKWVQQDDSSDRGRVENYIQS